MESCSVAGEKHVMVLLPSFRSLVQLLTWGSLQKQAGQNDKMN